VNEFGGIDLLVSNAAVNPIFGPILDVSICCNITFNGKQMINILNEINFHEDLLQKFKRACPRTMVVQTNV
jgi:NAD(P)-dependent dehydrogenase (short-subunit alcohol dehydrogenase family)